MSKSSTITDTDRPRPIHPGEILREDFLPDFGLTPTSLARELKIPRDRIEKIVRERRGITADTAARLGRYFGTSAQFWMNLQAQYDLARLDPAEIQRVTPRAA
ncbi:MAG TPA: HigA family addiction module antitoxin [Aurantimonas sp.]